MSKHVQEVQPIYLCEVTLSHFERDLQRYLDYEQHLISSGKRVIPANEAINLYSEVLFRIFWNEFSKGINSNFEQTHAQYLDKFIEFSHKRNLTIDYKVFFKTLHETIVLEVLFRPGGNSRRFLFDVLLPKLMDGLGYDVNHSVDCHGKNLIMMMIEKDVCLESIQDVIEFGADPDIIIKGTRPLHCVSPISFGFPPMLRILTKYGVDIQREEAFLPISPVREFIGDKKVNSVLDMVNQLIDTQHDEDKTKRIAPAFIPPLTEAKLLLQSLRNDLTAQASVEQLTVKPRARSAL